MPTKLIQIIALTLSASVISASAHAATERHTSKEHKPAASASIFTAEQQRAIVEKISRHQAHTADDQSNTSAQKQRYDHEMPLDFEAEYF